MLIEQAHPAPLAGTRPPDAAGTGAPVLRSLMTGPLPEDVRACEVTVVALFRASLVLNVLTGGEPGMTFSARCFRARVRAAGPVPRLGWAVAAAGIDAACYLLRGERTHCAAAWRNYRRRPGHGRNTARRLRLP